VLEDSVVVGRIFKVNATPVGTPWMWTLAFGQHEDRSPTHGYDLTPLRSDRAHQTDEPQPDHRGTP
jgi:hypothetical protein